MHDLQLTHSALTEHPTPTYPTHPTTSPTQILHALLNVCAPKCQNLVIQSGCCFPSHKWLASALATPMAKRNPALLNLMCRRHACVYIHKRCPPLPTLSAQTIDLIRTCILIMRIRKYALAPMTAQKTLAMKGLRTLFGSISLQHLSISLPTLQDPKTRTCLQPCSRPLDLETCLQHKCRPYKQSDMFRFNAWEL